MPFYDVTWFAHVKVLGDLSFHVTKTKCDQKSCVYNVIMAFNAWFGPEQFHE